MHGGDLYRHVLVPFGALPRAGRHAESGVYVCKAVCVQLFGKDMANFLGEITSQTVACSQLKIERVVFGMLKFLEVPG